MTDPTPVDTEVETLEVAGEEDVTTFEEDDHSVDNIEDFIGEEVDDPVARILEEGDA